MKFSLVLMFLLILSVKGIAQLEWHERTNEIPYYLLKDGSYFEGTDHSVRVIAFDSSKSDGNQIFHYNFPSPQKLPSQCYTPIGQSWIGGTIKADLTIEEDTVTDVTFVFQNSQGRQIKVMPMKPVGFEWPMLIIDFNRQIDAKIESQAIINWQGYTDTVKTISLQMKDLSQPVEHPVNEMRIMVGRDLGLIETFSFRDLLAEESTTSNTGPYQLVGLSSLMEGVNNLTWQKVWNVCVGDEIHVMSTAGEYSYPKTLIIDSIYRRTTVINIVDDPPNLILTKSEDFHHKKYENGSLVQQTILLNDIYDEVIEPNPMFDEYTEHSIYEDSDVSYQIQFTSTGVPLLEDIPAKGRWGNFEHFFISPAEDTCWQEAIIHNPCELTFCYEGLGCFNRGCFNNILLGSLNEIVYIKTRNLERGSPLDLMTSIPKVRKNSSFSIHPNPATSFFEMTGLGLHNEIFSVMINSVNGAQVRTWNSTYEGQRLNVTGIPDGLYLVSMIFSDGSVATRKLVIQNGR